MSFLQFLSSHLSHLRHSDASGFLSFSTRVILATIVASRKLIENVTSLANEQKKARYLNKFIRHRTCSSDEWMGKKNWEIRKSMLFGVTLESR